MTKLKINKEFAMRHGFALAVFLGLGAWFAHDAFSRYPATPARDLYAEIERAEPPEAMDARALEAFKAQKTATQKTFALATLLAGAWVAAKLLSVAAFKFSFDAGGFETAGGRFAWSDVASVDEKDWEKKGILRITAGNGAKFALDAWHHAGVKEFKEELEKHRKETKETANA